MSGMKWVNLQKLRHQSIPSFKKVLSGKQDRSYVSEYFSKFSPRSFGSV